MKDPNPLKILADVVATSSDVQNSKVIDYCDDNTEQVANESESPVQDNQFKTANCRSYSDDKGKLECKSRDCYEDNNNVRQGMTAIAKSSEQRNTGIYLANSDNHKSDQTKVVREITDTTNSAKTSDHLYPSRQLIQQNDGLSKVSVLDSLPPNFKLTMKENIAAGDIDTVSTTTAGSSKSMIIGGLGSTSAKSTVLGKKTTTYRLTSKQKVRYKYPNIELAVIPKNYPLLDHDYCYENYCNIVLAATKLLDKLHEQKLKEVRHVAGKSEVDGKPAKRKYRTKRVIAEEKEAERRMMLQLKADSGNELAKQELEEIRINDLEMQQATQNKTKRKYKKRKSTNTEEEEGEDDGKDDEGLHELNAEVHKATDPVKIHGSAFQDQFLYFGTKKYRSSRRHSNKPDPYQSFWTTGVLPNNQAGLTSNLTGSNNQDESSSSTVISSPQPTDDMMSTANEEINDVLDILGITSCGDYAGTGCTQNMDLYNSNTTTDMVSTVPMEGVVPLPEHSNQPASPSAHETSDVNDIDIKPMSITDRVDSGCILEDEHFEAVSDDKLNELLSSMTAEQISQVIQALDKPPDSESTCDTSTSSGTSFSPPSLASLAGLVCKSAGLPVSESQTHTLCSQQSQTSNLSVDLEDSELLSSERNLSLELFNQLTSSPPKSKCTDSRYINDSTECISTGQCDWESSCKQISDEDSATSPVVVPVTMFWNTFPALLIDGVKYVRLIDISRQALPSKETGLLKKRALTLGHSVLNCSDLQRNLLVKYAFASPSRSNLMISELAASQVIASYMEKSEIEELSQALPTAPMHTNQTKILKLPTQAPAEPVTLMPQVLVEHKPLQKSKSTDEKPKSEACESMPERSSRLRQVKSSYRRFLHLGSNSGDKEGAEENASDRGYHSDRSPDSANNKQKSTACRQHHPNKNKSKRGRKTSKQKSTAAISGDESYNISNDTQNCPTIHLKNTTPALEVKDLQTSLASSDSETVQIRHVDLVPRRNGALYSQDGEIYLKLFKSLHSPCIQCCTCKQFFTLRVFTKHQHHNKKLIPVKVRQRLEARESSIDSKEWTLFKQWKQLYESNRSPLKKLVDTKVEKPPETQEMAKTSSSAENKNNIQLGKRARKQKTLSPDEVYPCLKKAKRMCLGKTNVES